jgi:predicted RNA-binding Zn-ribbon protein involved in translation (DUF1610 family)
MSQIEKRVLTLPKQKVSLPSKGWFYDPKNPLSKGEIELYIPTARHEDILMSPTLIKKEQVLNEFIKEIIVDDKVDFNTMLLGDKSYLTIVGRILLYGPEYTTNVTCPDCGKVSENDFNLEEIKFKELDFANIPKNKNEFEFTSKYMKDLVIRYKLLSHSDEQQISRDLKRAKSDFGLDKEITIRLASLITKITTKDENGNTVDITSPYEKQDYIESHLPARISREFREKVQEITPSPDMSVDFSCKHCGHEANINLPFDIIDFFYRQG